MRTHAGFRILGGLAALLILSPLLWPRAGLPAWVSALPVCGFKQLLGRPCPLCGMTTSLKHFMAGQLRDAWRAHRVGPVVFVYAGLCGLVFPASRRWARVRPWDRRLRSRPVVWSMAAVVLASWCIHLFFN